MTNPPHDRPIRVRTTDEGLWIVVRWSDRTSRFDVIDGDGSWIETEEIEAWEPAPHPAISVGQPKD